MDYLGFERFVILGILCGGLIVMMFGVMCMDCLIGVVMNDIGLELDIVGLLVIMGYLGCLFVWKIYVEVVVVWLSVMVGFVNVFDSCWCEEVEK